jgi:hypothetical protein
MPSETPRNDPEWVLAQAWAQVGRATTHEDRARALSTFRRAIATAIKHEGQATPSLLERVEQLEAEARRLYDEQADLHVRKAIRALGSLRMAVEARLDVHAGGRRAMLGIAGAGGEPAGSWEVDLDEVMAFYGVPKEHRDGRLVVELSFSGTPDVRVYRGRKLAWRSPSKPDPKPLPRRALPHEEPAANGNGKA